MSLTGLLSLAEVQAALADGLVLRVSRAEWRWAERVIAAVLRLEVDDDG